ncbi:MAG: hypothetical protein WCP69_03005 [Bacteroidota bacterium]
MKKVIILAVMLLVAMVSGNSYAQTAKALTPSIGGKTTGSSITKAASVAAGKIALNVTDKKVSFFMMAYKNKLQNVELISNSENLTTEMKNAINAMATGTVVTFAKIACKPVSNANAAPERVGEFTITIQ